MMLRMLRKNSRNLLWKTDPVLNCFFNMNVELTYWSILISICQSPIPLTIFKIRKNQNLCYSHPDLNVLVRFWLFCLGVCVLARGKKFQRKLLVGVEFSQRKLLVGIELSQRKILVTTKKLVIFTGFFSPDKVVIRYCLEWILWQD